MRTRQEIFDKAWTGLESQGFLQSKEPGRCMYRGFGGRRCAVGWCIPDEKYDPGFEGRGPTTEICEAVGLPDALGFLTNLQKTHDEGYTPKGMEQNLRRFAREHNLIIPGEAP